MSKALLGNNKVTAEYWMGPMGALAAAVINRAYVDYLKGSPEQKWDAYKFLVEEDCSFWKGFVSLAPGWNEDIVPPDMQTGLTQAEKDEAVELYRQGMIAVRGLSIKFKCPYGVMSSFIRSTLPADEIKRIEDTRKHRQFRGVVKDRLSGVSTHNAAIFNHVAQWKVLEWFKQFMASKGVVGKDYMHFLQELSKRDRGDVREEADRLIKELECTTWD